MRAARELLAIGLELTAAGLNAIARKVRPRRPWMPLLPDPRFYRSDAS